MVLEKPSERFELSTPGLQDQCSNPWATKALARLWGNVELIIEAAEYHTQKLVPSASVDNNSY